LRWQDFCAALRRDTIKGQTEKFICGSFAEYLEESDMAYREDITDERLAKIAELFDKIMSSGEGEIVPKNGFNTQIIVSAS